MSKFKKAVLITLSIASLILFLTSQGVFARHVDSIREFRIEGYKFTRTDYLYKETNSGYVVNMKHPGHPYIIRVRHCLINKNNEQRSQWNLTTEGSRGVYGTWSPTQKGYYYGLSLSREFSYDGIWHINGSWSPDDR